MARPSNTEQRRTEITQAFLKVMAERGYDGASIGDVARAAQLSPGLVHYHFENKRAILLSALDQLLARHLQRLDERLSAHDQDPARQLREFLDLHLATGAAADPEALKCWILLSAEALRESRVRAAFDGALGELLMRLEALLQRGSALKVFACESPAAAASAILALIQGYFVLAATARGRIPRSSAAPCARLMAEGLLGIPAGILGKATGRQPTKRLKASLAGGKSPAVKTPSKHHARKPDLQNLEPRKVDGRRGRA